MSKALAATCKLGIVSVNGFPVPGAILLSEGVAESEGFLIIDEGETYYVAKTSPDLKSTLDKVIDVLGTIKDALQLIVTGPVTVAGSGAGPTDPTLVTNLGAKVTAIASAVTDLGTLKDGLL